MAEHTSMGRRRFMTATAAGAAAVVQARHIRGSQANERVKVGCIGLGGRGRLIAKKIQEHGGYQITAVADYFPDVAQKSAADLKVAAGRAFSGLSAYRRLIDSGVEAVVLETPPYCFPDHATAAVAAGCHVYMAKPVAVDVPGCLAIGRAGAEASKKKQVFFVDFQMRVEPNLMECVRRLHAGSLGTLKFVRCFYDDNGFPDPPLTDTVASRLRHLIWVNDMALGGGKLVNAGIHAVDAALWIIGKTPTACSGRSVVARPNPHGDAVDCYSLTYQFSDETPLMNYSGQEYPNTAGFLCGCDAFGEGGFLEARYGGRNWIRGGKEPFAGGETPNLYVYGIEENLRRFHRAIREGDASNPTVESSVNANLACILGREAARQQKVITWDEMLQAQWALEPDLRGLQV